MRAVRRFVDGWRRYDFPCQLPVVWDRVVGALARRWCTFAARTRLRLVGGRHGRNWVVDGPVVFRSQRRNSIVFGDNCMLVSRFAANLVGGTNRSVFVCLGEGAIRFGHDSGASFVVLSSRAGITLGDRVKLGGNVRIFDHDFHALDPRDRRDGLTDAAGVRSRPVCIGDDVFIGTNSIVLKGTSIGDRSIIGAGSVVSGTIPADEIWAGNPARRIRSLAPGARDGSGAADRGSNS